MSTLVGPKKSRYIAHRITAHRMKDRGQSLDVIADHLRVSTRSVLRYLEKPCPEPEPAAEIELEEFFMKGACGSFPELDWQTRSPKMADDCKAVCAYCPVLAQCRAYGLGKGLRDIGIWGGLKKDERGRLARQSGVVLPGEFTADDTDDDELDVA